MTPPLMTTIGTSVLFSPQNNNNNNNRDGATAAAAHLDKAADQQHSSLLLSAMDSIHTTDNIDSINDGGNDCTGQRRRLVLSGPPKSGRSSLAMDLAYDIASHSPCRLHCQAKPCQCIAVTVFVPVNGDEKNENDHSSLFPLKCSRSCSSKTDVAHDFDGSNANAATAATSWDADVLKRIRIHHIVVASGGSANSASREICEHLLFLQGLPVQEQPWGGIVLDDLDRLTAPSIPSTNNQQQQQQSGSSLGVSHEMSMSQLCTY